MTNSANPNALPLARRWLALTLAGRLAAPDNAKAEIGGSAGPGLKSKPVLDLGEFRPVRVGAGRLWRFRVAVNRVSRSQRTLRGFSGSYVFRVFQQYPPTGDIRAEQTPSRCQWAA
jgi:hypothetical protein